ncbi:MAG TPA: hypothetical protein PKH33_10570 [bacterium]|nr:hypothetical protein [bacterium]
MRKIARAMIAIAAFSALASPCVCAERTEPAAVSQKDSFIFARSTENQEENLWQWREGAKLQPVTSGKGVGRFVLANNPPAVVYQVPMGEPNPYQRYGLTYKSLAVGDAEASEPIIIDKPENNLSDLNQIVSPDGSRAVFTRVDLEKFGTADYDAGLWQCKLGTAQKKTELFWKSSQKHPGMIHVPVAFSPNGKYLAAQRTPFSAGDIGDSLIIDTRTKTVYRIFTRARVELWHPKGDKILASRIDASSGRRIFFIGTLDVSDWKPVTPEGINDGSPAFSPDGKKLAVHSRNEYGDSLGIWLVDVPSGSRKRLTPLGGLPKWSADGKKLFFRRRDDSTEWVPEIWVIDATGGEPKMLVKNGDRMRVVSSPYESGTDEGGR